MDTRSRIDFPKSINTSIENQIKLADTKAAWIFSVLSVGTGALVSRTSKIDWSLVDRTQTMILLIISIALIIISFKHVVRVIYPRISKGNSSGVIYFGDILSQKKEAYVKKGLSIKEEEMVKQLYEQSHALSGIANKKFKSLKTALVSTILTILFISISIIFI